MATEWMHARVHAFLVCLMHTYIQRILTYGFFVINIYVTYRALAQPVTPALHCLQNATARTTTLRAALTLRLLISRKGSPPEKD